MLTSTASSAGAFSISQPTSVCVASSVPRRTGSACSSPTEPNTNSAPASVGELPMMICAARRAGVISSGIHMLEDQRFTGRPTSHTQV